MTSENEELCIAPKGCVKNLLQNIVKTGKNVLLYFEQKLSDLNKHAFQARSHGKKINGP